MSIDTIGGQLAEWGKVALLVTRGRHSGRPVTTAVGFAEEADGTLLIAAGEPDADWALNLRADPEARVTVGERTLDCRAEPVDDALERAGAVAALILKYGTPAEGLGRGQVFRLVPLHARSE